MRKILFLASLCVFALSSSVWAADVSGTWTVTLKNPMGQDETFNLDIKAAGEKLTITCSDHPALQTLEGTGTLKGDAIKMNLKSVGGQMAGIGLNLTGKVTGNKMAGTREFDLSGMGARGGAPGGGAPGGGAPGGGAPGGGAPGGSASGGAAGGGEPSDAWTAVKK